MKNVINVDQIISKYSHEVFKDAVEELIENEILFEGQFPFLSDASMRDRNFEVQKEIFRRYGYPDVENIVGFSFEVKNEGWMHCFCVFGGLFEKIKDVKKAFFKYFTHN